MCDQRHNKHTGDEDEEDIEFLRLAALKSLQNKKEPTSLQYVSDNFKANNESAIGQNSLYSSNRIDQQYVPTHHQISHNNYSNHNENFFPNSQRPTTYIHPMVTQNKLENYTGNHDAQNLNEPYVPRSIPTGTGHSNLHSSVPVFNTWATDGNTHHMRHGYHPATAYGNPVTLKNVVHDSISGGSLSNVQLSPRSLAFVEQNNDILARRKGGNISPNNYNRSPRRSKSPDYRRVSPNYSLTNSPPYRPAPPNYSPAYRPSPPPDFYKSTSPRRWSVSPHNYKKGLSRSPQPQSKQIPRQRSPGFIRKRTISRSPHRSSSRSPHIQAKPRTRSRSPTIAINSDTKNRSPPIISSTVRRFSRSPQQINERHGRKLSRSPKGNSPYSSRYTINKNHRSPTREPKRSPNGDTDNDPRQNRQRSPKQSSSNNLHLQYHNKNFNKRKNSASPSNQHQQMQRKRSRTPKHSSPLRKYPRRSRDRNCGVRDNDHEFNGGRINDSKQSPVNKKRRDINGVSRNRGNNVRHNTRKSQSPNPGQTSFYNNRKRRSRSRYLEKPKRYNSKDNYDRKRNNGMDYKMKENNVEKYEKQNRHINKSNTNENDKNLKNDNKLITKEDNNKILNVEINASNNICCNDVTSLTPPPRSNEEKTKKKNIDEKSNDPYDICNNNDVDNKNNTSENDDDDDDEDGIDLFPSDDSESETEGRFKSSSNRNERKTNVPTLSFAKLNSSTVPDVVKDLQDVCNNKNSKNVAAGHHRFDRRRGDRFKNNNDNSRYSRNEKRRYNDIRGRKNSRSRSIERKNKDEIGGKADRRDIDIDNKRKSMFKSTFQAIDNEGNKINTKINSKTERGTSLGKSNNNESSKRRFKDSEGSLKALTPPIDNLNKYKSAKRNSMKST